MLDQREVIVITTTRTEIREVFREILVSVLPELQPPYNPQHIKEDKPVTYRTRKYVRDLLHTTYPTIDKYAELGLLKKHYFGRRVLFREDELQLSVPLIKDLSGKKKKAA